MVGRSNEISRENCRVQDVDDEPLNAAARDTALSMAQALRKGIAAGRERTRRYRQRRMKRLDSSQSPRSS